jgi:hypothetical protein
MSMETIIYRNIKEHPYMKEVHTNEGVSSTADTLDASERTGPLSLELFFSCSNRRRDGHLDTLAPYILDL